MRPEYAEVASSVSLALSSIAVFISWRVYCRDRSHLQTDVEFHLMTGKGTAFLVRLVNKGRRLVSVREVGLRLHSGELLRTPDLVRPLVLGETESGDVLFPLYEYRDRISSPLDVSHAEAWDTTGRRYVVSCRRLRSQIAKEWTSETDWLGKA